MKRVLPNCKEDFIPTMKLILMHRQEKSFSSARKLIEHFWNYRKILWSEIFTINKIRGVPRIISILKFSKNPCQQSHRRHDDNSRLCSAEHHLVFFFEPHRVWGAIVIETLIHVVIYVMQQQHNLVKFFLNSKISDAIIVSNL